MEKAFRQSDYDFCFQYGETGVPESSQSGRKVYDTKKPVVKGVKANKVYRKTVKLSFSDNIGVKTATLNGKKITSGIRVSKKGTYQLIVTDKAGNKTKVKFKIK